MRKNAQNDVSVNVGGGSTTLFAKDRVIELFLNADNLDPNQATTLAGAVAKAELLLPTQDDPVEIQISAGSYSETQPIVITGDSYIAIHGPPQYSVARFYLTEPLAGPWLTIEVSLIELTDFYMEGNLNTPTIIYGNSAATGEQGQSIDFHRVWMSGGTYNLLHLDGSVSYSFGNVYSIHPTLTIGIYLTNGAELYSYSSTIYPDDVTAIASYYHVSSSILVYSDDITFGVTGSVLIFADSDASITLSNIKIRDFEVAVLLFSGSKYSSSGCTYVNCTSVNNEYDSTCSWISVGDQIDMININATASTLENTSMLFNDTTIDSRGTSFFGRLIVGARKFASEAFFGEGFNDLQSTVALRFNGISTYQDISAFLSLSNLVPQAMLSPLTAGAMFYIGDNDFFSTLELDIQTVINKGSGSYVWEYWNGGSWISIYTMTVNSAPPYTSYASNFASVIGLQELRRQAGITTDWVPTSVNGITRYWLRMRIVTTILISPVFLSIKLLGNTTVVHEDGIIAHYGKARSLKSFLYDISQAYSKSGASAPADNELYFSAQLRLARQYLIFNNTTVFLTFALPVPSDIDSSSKLRVVFTYNSSSAAANNAAFSLNMYIANISIGAVATLAAGSGTYSTEQLFTISLPVNQSNANAITSTTKDFFMPTLLDGQLIIGKFIRTNTSGVGDLYLIQVAFYYTSYKTSGIVE